jgi:hypothetical protein
MNPKVGYGAVASALTVIIVWLFKQFLKIDVPAEVASAFTGLSALMVGYMVPERAPKEEEKPT